MSVNGIGGASANYNVQQQAQRRTHGADATGTQKSAGEYDQAKYLQDLNSRLNARVVAGAWNGKDQFGGGGGSTVMVHPDFLRKMHDDPELGTKYEAKINEWAEIDEAGRKRLEEQGLTLVSSGMYIDENGEDSAYAVVSKSSGDDDRPAMEKTKNKKSMKEEMEEMLERIAEKRQKKKLEAERIAGGEVVEKRTEASYTVDTLA